MGRGRIKMRAQTKNRRKRSNLKLTPRNKKEWPNTASKNDHF
jgi:hypothetical protein